MSSYGHLIPPDLKGVTPQPAEPEFGSFRATQGQILFNSSSARQIAEVDTFDTAVNQLLKKRYKEDLLPIFENRQQDGVPANEAFVDIISNGAAKLTNAVARVAGFTDEDLIFSYAQKSPQWLPNGGDLFELLEQDLPPSEWTDDEKETWYVMKKDPEIMKLVEEISPSAKERRLDNLRSIRNVASENISQNYAQSDGFLSKAAEFGAQAGSYLMNDPPSTASILFPVAAFRMAKQGAKVKLAGRQGLVDALPFAATFPAIGLAEEMQLLDLGAEQSEAREALYDRLLEVPAAFALRGAASFLTDAILPAGRRVIPPGGGTTDKPGKPPETPKTPPDPPTNPTTPPPAPTGPPPISKIPVELLPDDDNLLRRWKDYGGPAGRTEKETAAFKKLIKTDKHEAYRIVSELVSGSQRTVDFRRLTTAVKGKLFSRWDKSQQFDPFDIAKITTRIQDIDPSIKTNQLFYNDRITGHLQNATTRDKKDKYAGEFAAVVFANILSESPIPIPAMFIDFVKTGKLPDKELVKAYTAASDEAAASPTATLPVEIVPAFPKRLPKSSREGALSKNSIVVEQQRKKNLEAFGKLSDEEKQSLVEQRPELEKKYDETAKEFNAKLAAASDRYNAAIKENRQQAKTETDPKKAEARRKLIVETYTTEVDNIRAHYEPLIQQTEIERSVLGIEDLSLHGRLIGIITERPVGKNVLQEGGAEVRKGERTGRKGSDEWGVRVVDDKGTDIPNATVTAKKLDGIDDEIYGLSRDPAVEKIKRASHYKEEVVAGKKVKVDDMNVPPVEVYRRHEGFIGTDGAPVYRVVAVYLKDDGVVKFGTDIEGDHLVELQDNGSVRIRRLSIVNFDDVSASFKVEGEAAEYNQQFKGKPVLADDEMVLRSNGSVGVNRSLRVSDGSASAKNAIDTVRGKPLKDPNTLVGKVDVYRPVMAAASENEVFNGLGNFGMDDRILKPERDPITAFGNCLIGARG